MNKPNNMKGRQRGRNGGKGPRPMGGGGRPGGFDGGAGRMRGNAQQLMEKYLSLARDASSAGDRVLAENYFQHADHYYRVLNARFEQQQNNGQHRRFEGGQQNYDRQGGYNNQGYNQDRGYDDQGNQQHPDQHHYQQQPQHQHQPQHQNQPQHQHQPPAQHQQVQPQQPREPQPQPAEARGQGGPQGGQDSEIGLPPGILGVAPAPQAPEQGEARNEGEQDERRHQGRRRRGRGDRAFAGAGE